MHAYAARFRKTLPVRVVAGAAVFATDAFFASPLAVPLVKVPIAFFFAGAAFVVAVFLTTVLVLASLVSLFALTRRPSRVAGREAGAFDAAGAAAARRVPIGAVVLELELAFDTVVTFLAPAARDDFALSTRFDNMFDGAAERAVAVLFKGDPGLAICDLAGDAGLP